MKRNFYFCTVKTPVRHVDAAIEQLFSWSNFLLKLDTERIKVCGSSNAHRFIALGGLTAPCNIILLMSNFK